MATKAYPLLMWTPLLLGLAYVGLFSRFASAWGLKDPTRGFAAVPLNQSNLVVQWPYDLPLSDRYRYLHGIYKLWVFSTDKPHTPTSKTRPRTEIRIKGYDYSSGVWQFEGYGYVPYNTSGVCIMQVFGASTHATTLMLWVYNGSLYYYRSTLLVPNIYGRWFRLNVIHDVDASKLKVYIDGELKFEAPVMAEFHTFFKFGVYAQDNSSYYMESHWKRIKVLKHM